MDQLVAWLVGKGASFTAVATVVLLVAAGICITALRRLLRRAIGPLQARLHVPYETALLITRLVSVCLWLLVVLLILEVWGIGIGGVWTFLASVIAVVGVGFLAVWTIVSNATAGLFITVWRPFQLGQVVEILPEALKGRVVDRNMMFTVLREENGSALHIPNNLFFQRVFRVTASTAPSLFESLEGERTATDAGAPRA
jgi:small-conductance mechanosensitive channel